MCSYDRVNSKSYAELNVAIFFHSAKFSLSVKYTLSRETTKESGISISLGQPVCYGEKWQNYSILIVKTVVRPCKQESEEVWCVLYVQTITSFKRTKCEHHVFSTNFQDKTTPEYITLFAMCPENTLHFLYWHMWK